MTEKQIKIENLRFLKDFLPELNIEVETPCGYSKILTYDITSKDSEYWTIETNSGKRLCGSKDHLIKNDLGQFIKIENIINNISKINIRTKDGIEQIK